MACVNCWACEPLCPNRAIFEAKPHFLIDADKCTECLGDHADPQCVAICPIEGAIVNILSVSAHGGQSFLTVYSATKTMLGALTKNVAFSVLPHRIRVNGLNIGWMNTPGEHAIQKRAHGAPEDWLEKAAAGRPFGRLLEPAEVARAVAFLCSAESGMMTGSLVDFDQSVLGCWDEPPVSATRLL